MKNNQIYYRYRKNRYNKIVLIAFFTILILCPSLVYPQSYKINGSISASRLAVQYASVTFIDNSDTSRKFTAITNASGSYQVDIITSVKTDNSNVPAKFTLEQNYPNPFSSTTSIPYQLKKESDVHVTIYDILGREVKKFTSNFQASGSHNILWDGHNNFGQEVASGVYFYRVNADGESQVKKMIFNQSRNGVVALPYSYSITGNTSLSKTSNIENMQGNTFTVRIQNTSTTTPLIVSQELKNVVINNDTTIDFAATYIPVATVNIDSLHQIIRGFGATNLFFFGRPDMTDSEIQTAFGTGDGQLGFTILRIGIDVDSTHWSLSVPTAKKALAMGATVIASPWFAPSNMVETVNGVSRVRHDMYAQYAARLNSFIAYMKNNGVPIYGISIQNEPDITDQWTSWTANEIFTFMQNNASSIVGAKVMDPESFHFNRSYSDPILNDSAACANTDIICGHIYGGGIAPYPLAQQKGKEVWMTEYLINTDGNGANMDTSWNAAMLTANSINNCLNVNMSAYVWWYIVRYYGPIDDGTYLRKGTVTRKGYAMSQFSRFIRPGYYRVESSVYPSISNVKVTAYKDPLSSKIVIIAINSNSTQTETALRVQNESMTTSFTPYTSSAAKSCLQGADVPVVNGGISVNLEPLSITTFISN